MKRISTLLGVVFGAFAISHAAATLQQIIFESNKKRERYAPYIYTVYV